MQITPQPHGDLLELKLSGRLDAEWADLLKSAIQDALRRGSHALMLDFTEVHYVSSAGLSVLVNAHQKYQEIRGFFGIGGLTGPVEEVVRLTGLSKLLLCDPETVRKSHAGAMATVHLPVGIKSTSAADYEVYDLETLGPVEWECLGKPDDFDSLPIVANPANSWEMSAHDFAIGLGAFSQDSSAAGSGAAGSQTGELLAAAGVVAIQPAGGATRPDYQILQGGYSPRPQLLYGLRCSGEPRWLLRFDQDDREEFLPLYRLAESALETAGSEAALILVLAETSGLVGATLRQSPTASFAGGSRFEHPAIRDWLAWTPQREHGESLVMGVGVVTSVSRLANNSPLKPFLRPLANESDLWGHFHAAIFPFRPFKKRLLDWGQFIPGLFESGTLQGVMHLVNDDRPIIGAGDSEFIRGACWVGPLAAERGISR